MVIKASNGKEFYLVEVIAFVLKYLREKLEKHTLRDSELTAADFDWVITVPAIWRSRGKRMMREAAYQVILLTD